MTPIFLDNPWELFTAISTYCRDNNVKAISDDDPIHRTIGFTTDLGDQDPQYRQWKIRLTSLREIHSAKRTGISDTFAQIIIEKIKSASGREDLARVLSSGVSLS